MYGLVIWVPDFIRSHVYLVMLRASVVLNMFQDLNHKVPELPQDGKHQHILSCWINFSIWFPIFIGMTIFRCRCYTKFISESVPYFIRIIKLLFTLRNHRRKMWCTIVPKVFINNWVQVWFNLFLEQAIVLKILVFKYTARNSIKD